MEHHNQHNLIDTFEQHLIEGVIRYVCSVGDCTANYNDRSNAIRHLRQNHSEKYKEIKAGQKKTTNQISFDKCIEIRVRVDPSEILKSCISLITVRALPISAVEYPEFKTILRPYKESLALKGIKLAINTEIMKKHIESCAEKITEMIADEMKEKLVCLLVDIASRYNRSIMGVNAAYMVDGNLTVRTIGMHVLHCSHTSTNLIEFIKKDLIKFNLTMDQIISLTTDNGRNLIKMVADLDAEYQSNNLPENVQTEAGSEQTESDDSDFDIDDDVFDDQYYMDLLDNMRSGFDGTLHKNLIHGISCAAHMINLVVMHGLEKCVEVGSIIQKARDLIIRLRTPTFVEMIKALKLNTAKLDVKTRWNSIYVMVCVSIHTS